MNNRNENRQRYKKTKVGFIPNEWNIFKLSEVANVLFSNVDKKNNEGEEEVFLCNYTDVYYNEYITSNLVFMKATASKSEIEKFRLEKDDVIITKDSETFDDIAVSALVKEELQNVICGYHLAIIRPIKSKVIGDLLHKLFKLHSIRCYFSKLANGVTRFGLSSSSVQNAIIPVPTLNEQKRIAEILSTWDRAIGKVAELIKLKERRKRGLMQQLLSGRMRFPEFGKGKKRRKIRFGDVPEDWSFTNISDISCEVSERVGNKKGITVLSCTKYKGLVSSLKYFGKQIFSEDQSNYKIVRKGYFAYATNHIEEGSIGLLYSLDIGCVSPMYTVFRTNDDFDVNFLYFLLKTDHYIQIYEKLTSASINRRGSLRWKEFKKIQVAIPSMQEQLKIAECINSCDKEILLLKKELEELKIQKKGLMQKLLTGQIRVKA